MSINPIKITQRTLTDWDLDLPKGHNMRPNLRSGGSIDIYRVDGGLEVCIFDGLNEHPVCHMTAPESALSANGEG